MALIHKGKPSFASGEISPLLYDRTDFERYESGLARCENFVIRPQGSATRRPPTEFIAEALAASILVPFEFSRDDSYQIEIGNLKARFFRDGGMLEASPGVAYEVALPYTTADLARLRHVNSGDIVYLLHAVRGVRKLARFGDTNWQVSAFGFKFGPFLDLNVDSGRTLKSSAASGTVTLTPGGWTFDQTHVGALFKLGTGIARIVSVAAGGDSAQATVTRDIPSSAVHPSTTADWQEGAFSDFRGWPDVAVFHQQRLWFGKGNFLYGSAVADFEMFDVTGDPADALAERVGAGTQRNNDMVWLSSGKVLAIGTLGEEFSLQAASANDGISATNLKIVPATTEGSKPIDPVRVGGAVLHVSKTGRQLRRLIYDFQIDDFRSDDLTVASEHMTAPGVQKIAWQRDPLRVLWLLLTNGELRGFTFNPEQEVLGWHRHPSSGAIDDISITPAPDGSYDELWMIVRRTIAGSERRYVERMLRYFDHETDADPAVVPYLDCQLSGGPIVETVTDLDFLEGETVSIVMDGNAITDRIVEFGRVDLPRPAERVTVGLPFRSRLQLLPTEVNLADGSSDGRQRNVKGIVMRLHGAPGGLIGRLDALDRMERIHVWQAGQMDVPPKLFKGKRDIDQSDGWSAEDFVDIVFDEPFAADVLSAARIVDLAEA